MKFTLNWLQEYVQLGDIPPAQLADDLTMLGLEVDSVMPLYEELADLRTATIISAEPHPNADKLTLCQVAVGEQRLQIVCGAPNVYAGMCAVVALPGTTLPGNFKIKKSKVRGVESQGMLCSERELGLGEDHSGIIEMVPDTPHGESYVDHAGLRDTMVEVDLTPNRPDCASVIGVAREVAGIYHKQLHVPYKNSALETTDDRFAVEVENPELCPRYAAKLIRGVKIGPSPWWLKKRLISIGLRPINNVVDITNLVMLEYGQPLHAFDFNTLAGGKIVVRTPRSDEKNFTTLDGVKRSLDRDMLMICDAEKPVAVGGVMGGLDSEVTDVTTDVLLESACFNPVSIRKTARRLNLSTDASYRFERGVDPLGTLAAMQRAADLIVNLTGGVAEKGGIDVHSPPPVSELCLRVSKTCALLGVELSRQQIIDLLVSIEISCKPGNNEDTITVEPPSFRVDLEREADLIEEVARIYGYNNIPVTLPSVDLSYPEQDSERIKRNELSRMMTRAGFAEVVNYSFVSSGLDDALSLAGTDYRRSHVAILNPLTEDQNVMRTSLLPGLLENVKRNLSFQQISCRLFEIGKVFLPEAGKVLPEEPTRISGVLVGNRYGRHSPLHFKHAETDIFDAKGTVEIILESMRLDNNSAIALVPAAADELEPFADENSAMVVKHQDRRLGSIGKFQSERLRPLGIKRDVFYFDLDFSALCSFSPTPVVFKSLPVFPAVKRDIAIVVPENTPAGELVRTVLTKPEKFVEHCAVFDVYQGDKIQRGFKSVALTITYRSDTKTLTEKNVEKVHAKIIQRLTESYGGALREE